LLNEYWPTGIYTPGSHIGVGQKKFKVPIEKKQFHKWFEEIENKIEILDLIIIHYYRVEGIVY
jgi:hypothetical protein